MPGALRWASPLLALTAVGWIAVGLFAWVAGSTESAYRPVEADGGWNVPTLSLLGVLQLVLCVVVRLGRQWARVCLTLTTVPLGLLAFWAVADFDGGDSILGLGVMWLLFGGSALGVVLLHLPSTNAYFAEVRRLRGATRPPLPG